MDGWMDSLLRYIKRKIKEKWMYRASLVNELAEQGKDLDITSTGEAFTCLLQNLIIYLISFPVHSHRQHY